MLFDNPVEFKIVLTANVNVWQIRSIRSSFRLLINGLNDDHLGLLNQPAFTFHRLSWKRREMKVVISGEMSEIGARTLLSEFERIYGIKATIDKSL